MHKEKPAETTKQQEEERKKSKPEEREGMPQYQHCPHEKRHGDRNSKYHEEQHNDVAWSLATHPPKNTKKEHK
jgi:hypothetical protein